MDENGEKRAPQFILEEILDETFRRLEANKDFDSKLILELQKLTSEDNIQNEKFLLSTLRGDSQ
ncbi:hypothetical protein [Methanobacterium ferruginis]|uniref:hypothetical protein n=1 Tax=Methanobacterium ferruginis TaxID=710191 RepID=UPI00257348F0|nr:hypothetical protein [Methanobacterium ferruginis]BDZ68752.1 hypothetical protein GCM10025860_22000 [Methanobacterium ferruginis]